MIPVAVAITTYAIGVGIEMLIPALAGLRAVLVVAAVITWWEVAR